MNRRAPSALHPLVASLVLAFATASAEGAAAAAAEGEPQATQAGERGKEAAASEQREARFDVLEIDVEGNQVLPATDIEKTVYPFLGEQRSMHEVEAARDALQKLYQDRGYLTVAVDIPVQKVENGLVRLHVTEGKVGRLRVVHSRYYSLGYIKALVPSLAPGQVPLFPEVREQLTELNRSADRRVAPVLRPGKAPGTVDVDLEVEDHPPVHGDIELNNRYNAYTHPLRLSGSLHYDNLWQSDHSLTLAYQLAPQSSRDANVFSLNYLAPLSGGNSLAGYFVHSRSDVVPGAFDTVGNGDIAGVRYIVPLPADAGTFHSMSFGIDHKRFGETLRLAGQDAQNTPIAYTPLFAQYALTTSGPSGVTQFSSAATLGLANTFGNKDADFENKRAFARASFLTLRLDASRTENLAHGLSLYAHASGQLADSPLISNEEFSVGGADTVRGYLEAEALGDAGLQGTLEVRSPKLWNCSGCRDLYALAFVDGGEVKFKQPLPGQTQAFQLVSRGIGLRVRTQSGLRLALDIATVARATQYTPAGSTRAEFRVGSEF